MRKTGIVVLFLFLRTSVVSAETTDASPSSTCIPFQENEKQVITILIQGEITRDRITALQELIRTRISPTRPDEDTVRIAILRDGVCVPSD